MTSYLRVADDLHAGRKPSTSRIAGDVVAVKDVCNHYLTFQLEKVDAGEIRASTFADCRRIVESFARVVGRARAVADLGPKDFQEFRHKISHRGLTGNGKGLGVHAVTRSITIVKAMLRLAYENDVIDRPVKYGKAFDRPSAAVKRRNRRESELRNGKRLFTAEEIRDILEVAEIPLKAIEPVNFSLPPSDSGERSGMRVGGSV